MPESSTITSPPDVLAVDVAGAAKLLGISQSHVFAMRRAGKFGPVPVRMGRCCRYRVAELTAWVNAGCPARARWQAIGGQRGASHE